jgi:hypothetical protein
MPRTCLACKSPDREKIDAALVAGESFRSISKRVSISPAGLLRHKAHVAKAIVKAADRREEQLGDNLYEGMKALNRRGLQLLDKLEEEKDHRGAVAALREVRECWQAIGTMIDKAGDYRRPLPVGDVNFFGKREINVIVEHIGGNGGQQGKPKDGEGTELLSIPVPQHIATLPALPEVVPTDEEKGRAASAGGSVENLNSNGSNGTKASGAVEMPTAEELKAWRKGDSTELQRLGPSFSPGPRLSWPIRGRRNRH